MSKTFNFDAWVAADPSAMPSNGQVFALLMPSNGGLNTGKLRASEAAELLKALNPVDRQGKALWTREGLSRLNNQIRRSPKRRAAGQAWLDSLLGCEEVVTPAPAPAPAPKVGEGKRPDRVWVEGHWRSRPAKGD